ncbi:MAG TPA: F0F1 ATP synthase subunit A [Candidatus Paceibacterota bacterium]|nr:F0F1 ATP synthase subunit A [Candidatus Paceibacterota bacterium]
MFSFIATAHAAGDGIHVALKPYIVGELYGVPITATLITTWLAMAVLIIGAFFWTRRPQLIPKPAQSMAELMVGGVYDYMSDVLESRKLALKYFPVVMTIFIFVLALNWIGLLPGVTAIGLNQDGYFTPLLYPAATDLNITIAFAIIAFLTIEMAGVVALGLWKYGGKFINFSSPLAFVIGLIELISELARLISFSFRLFGNIFAGKTLLVVIIFFVPYIVPVPLYAFEVFVGFIQAFIFAILTLFFIKIAIAEPH